MTVQCKMREPGAPGGCDHTGLIVGLTELECVPGFAWKKWSVFLRSIFPSYLPSVHTDVIPEKLQLHSFVEIVDSAVSFSVSCICTAL